MLLIISQGVLQLMMVEQEGATYDVVKMNQAIEVTITKDTKVKITSKNVSDLVDKANQELSNIAEWLRINKRNPNPQKLNNW